MALNIYLYSYTKKKNSTAHPTSASGTSKSVILKQNTSIMNPTFVLSGTAYSTMIGFNYLEFESRWYFIDDIISLNNQVVEINAKVDVLATYRTAIGSYNGFIVRSSNSTFYNDNIFDNQIIPTATVRSQVSTIGSYPTSFTRTGGTYLVNTYGKSNDYVLSKDSFVNIIGDLLNTNTIWDDVESGKFNPSDYIRQILYLPYSASGIYPGDCTVDLGYVERNLTTNCRYLYPNSSDRIETISVTIPVSDITSRCYYTDFRRFDVNFTQITLEVPFVGVVQVPNDVLYSDTLTVRYVIDSMVGTGYCEIVGTGNNRNILEIMRTPITVGIECAISAFQKYSVDIVGGLFKGSYRGTLVDGLLPNESYHMIGSTGSIADLYSTSVTLTLVQHGSTSDEIDTEKGRLAMKKGTIGSVGGYMELLNPSISIDGFDSERDEINNYLQGGFYYV